MNSNRKTKKIMFCVLLAVGVLLTIVRNSNADFTFGTPINLGSTINTSVEEGGPCISPNGLELYFYSFLDGWAQATMRVATRETTEDPWGEVINFEPPLKSCTAPSLSANGLSLYFDKGGAGTGGSDIWVSTRATISDPWGEPVNLGPTVNSSTLDMAACVSADGLELYFGSFREGGYGDWDLWVAKRATLSEPWGEAVNLGPLVNSADYDGHPCISPDGLTLFITSTRPGGYGDWDIWMTRRATKDDDWGEPVNLGPSFNTSAGEAESSISVDGRTLYFSDWLIPQPGGIGKTDLWQVSIDPVVDLNGDGIVDAADMCIIVDNWGTDNSLCDIAPTPFGDGIVDVQDLIALAGHLFEDVNDPTLIAHWALDETEGMTARNSVNGSDDFVMGGPVWQPAGGMIGGALELDGIDDCIIGSTGLNPAEGPFSIVTWIKGGAPGQAIISQPAGTDWLALDAEGKLMTELNGLGQGAVPLLSQALITDE
jgi:Tol biopolymer transport system component